MRSEHLRFPGPAGMLAARLDLPDAEPRAYALFAHCFTCTKDHKASRHIARALAGRGIAVLCVDFAGLGESEGEFAATNFSSNLEDLLAAAAFLRREHQAPRLLAGHSLGGAAMLAVAPRIPEAVAVSTIGAPSDTGHLSKVLLGLAPELGGDAPREETEVDLGGARRVRIRRQLLHDLGSQNLREALRELGRPLLIFHSPVDQIVSIEHAQVLFRAAHHPKSFISLGAADHLLHDPRDSRFVGSVLASWADRYLDEVLASAAMGVETKEAGQPEELPPGEVRVVGTAGTLAQEVRVGRHHLVADEPAKDGGGDRGPTPYDLLVAALGACTSMTLLLYAARKQQPLAGVRVFLRQAKIYAKDCAECATREGKIDQIEREIELLGDLTAEQRARLLEIANLCPVHRTLTSEIRIVSRLR